MRAASLEDGNDPTNINVELTEALLPAGLITLTILYDVASAITWPVWIARVYACVTAPFRNFLYLEDLDEATPDVLKQRVSTPQWKLRALVGLSLAEALLSVAWSCHGGFHDKGAVHQNGIALALAWVSPDH